MNEQVTMNKWVVWLLGGISPMTIICATFYLATYKADIESRIFSSPEQKNAVISRAMDADLHMPYRQKVIEFVPRPEIEYKFRDIKEDLTDIKKALNIKS